MATIRQREERNYVPDLLESVKTENLEKQFEKYPSIRWRNTQE